MPILDLEGVQLYYEEKGSGEPVVFSHGIPTDYRAWNLQVDQLSKDHRTFCYSRRYAYPNVRMGDVRDSTVANNAADLGALIGKLNVGPVHLVGHSYGGFTAAYLAADHPELVRSLVLVEPAIATLLVEDETNSGQLLSLLLRSPSVALSARRFQNSSLKPSLAALDAGKTKEAVELNVDGVQDRPGAFRAMPEAARAMMLENAKTVAELRNKLPSFKTRASKITSRTLVVNGAGSALWLRRIGELTAAAIPKSRSAKVSSARHFPHMENPSEFNQLLLSFIAASGAA
jgi:non-heme chloroperoxidase